MSARGLSPLSSSSSEGGRPPSPPPSPAPTLLDEKRAKAAAKAALREEIARVKAASRRERAALITRRDTLSYFDTARVVGPLVFVDTVPLVCNALFVATVGNVVTFKDGGLRCVFPVLAAGTSAIAYGCDCGGGLHTYLQGLVGISYVILMYMTSVALGDQVTGHVNGPFIFMALTLGGLLAWGFFFGVPVLLVQLAEAGTEKGAKCWGGHPWLYCACLRRPRAPKAERPCFPPALHPLPRPPPSPPPPRACSFFLVGDALLQLHRGEAAPQVGRLLRL